MRGRRLLLSAGDGFYKHRTKGCCRDENHCGAEILGQSNRLTFKNLANVENRARKAPKASKLRLPQDGRGRRRLLSAEGGKAHALALQWARLPFFVLFMEVVPRLKCGLRIIITGRTVV